MRSVDTNVVVRFLMADDEQQFERAKRVFEQDDVLILTSVLLETEWVLRSNFRLGRETIVQAFRQVAGADGVRIEDAPRLFRALELAEQGLDLADALHVAGSIGCADFVSFDRPLARRAAALGAMPVNEP